MFQIGLINGQQGIVSFDLGAVISADEVQFPFGEGALTLLVDVQQLIHQNTPDSLCIHCSLIYPPIIMPFVFLKSIAFIFPLISNAYSSCPLSQPTFYHPFYYDLMGDGVESFSEIAAYNAHSIPQLTELITLSEKQIRMLWQTFFPINPCWPLPSNAFFPKCLQIDYFIICFCLVLTPSQSVGQDPFEDKRCLPFSNSMAVHLSFRISQPLLKGLRDDIHNVTAIIS